MAEEVIIPRARSGAIGGNTGGDSTVVAAELGLRTTINEIVFFQQGTKAGELGRASVEVSTNSN